ncbi:MAG: hypothetical protein HEQ31_23885 [Dolichospermum sp. OL03]|nr:hypothetical protein [Dolichospermum sp. OL01]MCO5799658.1 hypothetical protein [Dolichospermum sp. OL03]
MNQSHKALDLLLSLRNSVNKISAEIEVVMPDAISEALEIVATAKNKAVYNNKDGRIVLVFRKKFSTNKEDTKLARLDEDIHRITGELANKNSEQIAEIESQIEDLQGQIELLEKQRDRLLSDSEALLQAVRRITNLKRQYHEHRESTLYLDPNLSVFLND